MTTNSIRSQNITPLFRGLRIQRGLAFGIIIVTALFAFEIFNYSTTDFALSDLLGDLRFLSIRWSTILAIAFCGIDFAGIARLFTPEEGSKEPKEVWYLFGAWMLAATMNAMLTWWGVSLAIVGHDTLGSAVIAREKLLHIVPIFVAVMVWLIRVLIIGSFSVAGNRLFSQSEEHIGLRNFPRADISPLPARSMGSRSPTPRPIMPTISMHQTPKPINQTEAKYSRPDPTYHPVSMSANQRNSDQKPNPDSASPTRSRFQVRQ
jgi:hypothetical protein